jgi:hypothetical protein
VARLNPHQTSDPLRKLVYEREAGSDGLRAACGLHFRDHRSKITKVIVYRVCDITQQGIAFGPVHERYATLPPQESSQRISALIGM